MQLLYSGPHIHFEFKRMVKCIDCQLSRSVERDGEHFQKREYDHESTLYGGYNGKLQQFFKRI